MIRIGLRSWSVRPCPDTCRHAKFHSTPCARLWVILLTDRQTSRAIAYISPLLSEVNGNYHGNRSERPHSTVKSSTCNHVALSEIPMSARLKPITSRRNHKITPPRNILPGYYSDKIWKPALTRTPYPIWLQRQVQKRSCRNALDRSCHLQSQSFSNTFATTALSQK